MAEPVATNRVALSPSDAPEGRQGSRSMLLAGDVGGTKTLLGIFTRAPRRPRRVAVHAYPTSSYHTFTEILDAFIRDLEIPCAVDAAVIGVAGPVVGGTARLTNVGWSVSAAEVATRLNTAHVRLVNDLEAMATGAVVLDPEETVELQRGVPREDGNAVVIAAGTGLGEAYLHRVNGRLRAAASEGGHADFAARTDREMELVRMLRQAYGRAEVEHVLSGPGLLNLHRFTHDGGGCPAAGRPGIDMPAAVSRAAMDGSCRSCVEALELFVDAYGAETGNLALRGVATSGVFIGGGIAAQILPTLKDGRFIAAFGSKGAMSELVAGFPVRVILTPEAGLLGAAVAAQDIEA